MKRSSEISPLTADVDGTSMTDAGMSSERFELFFVVRHRGPGVSDRQFRYIGI